MGEFLLEIGTEEIPARFITPAKEGLENLLKEVLKASRIGFSGITTYATPRRMAAFIHNLEGKQEEGLTIKYGPPANRAFDQQNRPTAAATGFAKSQGVAVEDLKRVVKNGVEFIAVEKREPGRDTKDVLREVLPDVISRIPFQKKMRWGAEFFEYARPIQWILAIIDGDVIDFKVADVKSGTVTYGHRFLSPGPIEIKDPKRYIEILREKHIILSEAERMKMIDEGIATLEKEAGGTAIRDEGLIKEILYITEYPYPLKGSFDRKFLLLPKEVLINVMKTHQRYIPIGDEKGELLPYFIFFANTIPLDAKNVIRGNEKVLRARLADGQFFFEEDKRIGLTNLYERLSSIVFHVRLGSIKDKVERVLGIADYLATVVGYGEKEKVERAVRLMKADLLTHMVGEFPELQGVMGRIYALLMGEDSDVAQAIEEQYMPSGSDGEIPKTPLGTIVSLADKIDSLTSFFSVGITPTGNMDPYALRRQAIGIIRIIIDKALTISVDRLIEVAYNYASGIKKRRPLEETKKALMEFISTRFRFAMVDASYSPEFVEAILPYASFDIYDGYRRLLTLEHERSSEDFNKLVIGFKRAYNITKDIKEDLPVDTSLFVEPEEGALYNLYISEKDRFFQLMEKKAYEEALSLLVGFKGTIDNYFDRVFVMDKEERIKNNRLGLLKKIKDMFLTFGDFSKIHID
ncbi:MAG: glycine--tRNA ligase subunit beta [Syntrophorhabdaceae bacterium]|nr:glycine--tRNA ligase subunit beta [Syntrophorhabdaceae bacterium]